MANEAAKPDFSKWHGIDRKTINWGPKIDESKCVGCGLCVVQCSERRNVFGYDEQKRKAVVLNPENCMVGCNNCQVACLWDAITFPDVSEVRALGKKLVDSGRAKQELEARLGKNPNLIIELPPDKKPDAGLSAGERKGKRLADLANPPIFWSPPCPACSFGIENGLDQRKVFSLHGVVRVL